MDIFGVHQTLEYGRTPLEISSFNGRDRDRHNYWDIALKILIALSLTLFSSVSVFAQSTVTVYGVVDQFMAKEKSGATSTTRMRDGGHGASRLGFRGSEDLGGGLRANFVLEAGINGPTGQGTLPGPGLAFTRQSAVGLSGSWGRVDAGRMYTPVFYQLVRADVFDVNGVFSQLNLIGQKDGQSGTSAFAFRTNRIIRYRSPEAENLVLDMAYAFGEASESSGGSGKSLGGSIGWNQGPVYVGYSFQKYHTATGQAPTSTPSVSKFQVFSGSFRVTDTVRLSGNYIHTSSKYPTPSANLINFGASWNVGLSRFLASAIQRKVDASARSQVGWTLGYDYMLSKRTLLYARVLHLNNRHGASATIAGIEVSPNSGDNVSLSGIGIRHNF